MQVETVNKTHKKRGEEKEKKADGDVRTQKSFAPLDRCADLVVSWVAISPLATALGSPAKSLVKDLHAHVLVLCSCLWSYLCCCLFSYCFELCLFPSSFGFRMYVCVFDLVSSAGGAWNLEGLLCCSRRRTHGRTDGRLAISFLWIWLSLIGLCFPLLYNFWFLEGKCDMTAVLLALSSGILFLGV